MTIDVTFFAVLRCRRMRKPQTLSRGHVAKMVDVVLQLVCKHKTRSEREDGHHEHQGNTWNVAFRV